MSNQFNFEGLFVYDMANNHQGSVEHGLEIIDQIGEVTRNHDVCGALKFQFRHIDTFIHPDFKNKKDIKQIATYSLALIDRAKSNKLAPTDVEGGCITVSNLGAFGIDNFIPIVVPGQCSILGVGQISDTCVPDDGNIMVRKLMNMTLSIDHKVANGAYAAQFLDFVRKMLEDASAF